MTLRVLIPLLLCFVGVPAFAQNANLIRNGDFELESDQGPPPGWTMWGAEQSKNPKNYTRDTQNPRSGKAALRIYRPANTAGYIVCSPRDNAIRPRKGMAYHISFWAKTDKPGPSFFQVQGYSSLEPMAGYSTVAAHNCQVPPDSER